MFILHYDILWWCQPQHMSAILSLIIEIRVVFCFVPVLAAHSAHTLQIKITFNKVLSFFIIMIDPIIYHDTYFTGRCGVILIETNLIY